jgi:hypothetical protein
MQCRKNFGTNSEFALNSLSFNYLIYYSSVHTSQEAHYVSATRPNRLMLFRETVAVYCENHTEHTTTLSGQNAELLHIK